MSTPVFSRRDVENFTPKGSLRTYLIAPLTFRERQAFRAELGQEAGFFPQQDQMFACLRQAIAELAPGNAPELLAIVAAAENFPEDKEAQAQVVPIEAVCSAVPSYAALLGARARYVGMLPWVAARHALRGWDGPGLPTFARVRGVVPADLLDLLAGDEVDAVGWRASALMNPSRDTEGNSAALSPSPGSPPPTPAA